MPAQFSTEAHHPGYRIKKAPKSTKNIYRDVKSEKKGVYEEDSFSGALSTRSIQTSFLGIALLYLLTPLSARSLREEDNQDFESESLSIPWRNCIRMETGYLPRFKK